MAFRSALRTVLAAWVLIPAFLQAPAQTPRHRFALADSVFLLDGKPFQIISGELHYERIPRAYWRARLHMARVMGLNTIATYCFWNVHEPRPGTWKFTGAADVAQFVRMAQSEGLWVILRPGPYVCAEWEFGGYPWWLLKEKGLQVRSRDPRFLAAARAYLNELGRQLAPLQSTRGGPILMVQVENEYGSYGRDTVYETDIEKMIREAGFDVPLFTADGDFAFRYAALPGVLPGANGETDINQLKTLVNRYHGGKGPYFIPEYYPGWLDHWGEPFQKVDADSVGEDISRLLASGVSFNMYMFHGGTNFGFMNGANYDPQHPIQPDITSYDYDAPLSESGDPTPKFFAVRKAIQAYLGPGTQLPPVPAPRVHLAIPLFKLNETAEIFHQLPAAKTSPQPVDMEDLDQGYGLVLYRTNLPEHAGGWLKIGGLRDYAIVLVAGHRIGVLNRMGDQDSIELPQGGPQLLGILVENLGRINYGRELPDNHKGITGEVSLNGQILNNWKMYSLPFTHPWSMQFTQGARPIPDQPILRRGHFKVGGIEDTFLDMRGWGKGFVWVNGHALGRYWGMGPQQTLYLPGCWLKRGDNTLIVLEELNPVIDSVQTLDHPILDQLVK